MTELLTRELTVREVAQTADGWEFTALAVPYNQPAVIPREGITEVYAPGCVVDSDSAHVFWRHGEVVGRLVAARDTPAGWEVVGRLSDTTQGRDAYTLLRDGVVTSVSAGFRPIEHTETITDTGELVVTRTAIQVREVSLTPMPAYEGANVLAVRESPTTTTTPREAPPVTETLPDVARELQDSFTDLRREVAVALQGITAGAAQTVSRFRSAGQLLQALALPGHADHELATREYADVLERAYTGGTSADAIMRNTWVGDLTRIIDEAPGVRGLFSTGQLPDTGMTLEYGELLADTSAVAKQATEGADLTFGKVTVKTSTAPVETFGGYTQLTRQQIERSSVPILDHSLRALAIAANKHQNLTFRTKYAAAVTAQITAGNKVTVASGSNYADWVNAIIDAAIKYEDLALGLDGLIVGSTVFKTLAGMKDSANRPLMVVSGTGDNAVGTINAKGLEAELANVPVRLNAKGTATQASFYNKLAIRTYTSPVTRLQDENVINLSKDFSLYFYGATAVEIPAALVGVSITA